MEAEFAVTGTAGGGGTILAVWLIAEFAVTGTAGGGGTTVAV
jgi:hypothetical protein